MHFVRIFLFQLIPCLRTSRCDLTTELLITSFNTRTVEVIIDDIKSIMKLYFMILSLKNNPLLLLRYVPIKVLLLHIQFGFKLLHIIKKIRNQS